MKTYLECVREAADKMNAVNYYNSYQAILDYLRPILQEAADIYASQQGSINTSVVRPESNVGGGELLQGEGVEKGVSVDDDFDPFYDEGEEAKWQDRDETY